MERMIANAIEAAFPHEPPNTESANELRELSEAMADQVIAALPDMVKPLEWREESSGYWFANVPLSDRLSVYRAHPHRDGGHWCYFGDFRTDAFPDADAAKAAAQAHHRARIMSAFGVTL